MVPVAAATAGKDEGVALANLRSRLCFVNQRMDTRHEFYFKLVQRRH